MPASALSFPWNDFLQFQTACEGRTTCPASLGREEALTIFVGELDPDGGKHDSRSLRTQFDNLCCNRAAKYRHRIQLSKQFADLRRAQRSEVERSLLSGRGLLPENHTGMVAIRELLSLARQCVSKGDWKILWMLAEGYSYGEIAGCYGLTIGNLKSRLSRIRSRIRKSPVGRLLHTALY
jgi:hypothetical protein